MTTYRYGLWLYRLWKRRHGRIKAAWMAFKEATKPVPF